MTNVSVEFRRGSQLLSAPESADHKPGRGGSSSRRLLAQGSQGRAASVRARGVNETYRHFGAGLFPQGRGLPVGLPGAHARSRIHPVDRGGPLQRRLHGQLEIQRVSRDPRAHLRPAVRAGLPARARREGAGRDLPPEARRRRLQGRHPRAPAQAGRTIKNGKRIALVGGGPGLAHGRARPRAAGLRMRGVRRRSASRRHDAHADPEIPPARHR